MIDPVLLLREANAGNKSSYNELLRWLMEHSRTQIKKCTYRYRNFPDDSIEDIVQNVLITFHETHQTFDTEKSLLPWINTIIRHKAIDFMRRKEFKAAMTGIDLDLIEDHWILVETEENHGNESLMELMTQLPEEQKRILTLAKVEGLSIKEISQEMKLSESNVKVIVHRSIKLLKKLASSLDSKEEQ